MQSTELTYANSQYPKLLREISSPPQKLYALGKLVDIPLVAIVGSRRPTAYGVSVTTMLATELAHAGVGIVSGLALGIDATAHDAAVRAGGYTIAVLGSGLRQIYPVRNRGLAQRILKAEGVIITEQPPDMPALPHHFPMRNRIIAGMSLGVIVTEATAESGSLITATFGLNQNRTVMAVPGAITSRVSAGPNNLLANGARIVRGSSDVLEELNLSTTNMPHQIIPASKQEEMILKLLDDGVMTTQGFIDSAKFTAPECAHTLSLMEITGKIRNIGAGRWAKC